MDSMVRLSDHMPTTHPDQCSPAIRGALGELSVIFGETEVRLVDWYQYGIGAVITVQVNLPARGTVGEIDIRSQEPMVIVFNKTRFPYQVPTVFVDRADFPAQVLPHLYPAQRGQPAALCLHRGQVDDWFVEHSVSELVRRAQNWFEDAAGNRLIRNQDFFEATRLEISEAIGVSVYDPRRVDDFIGEQWHTRSESGWGVLICSPLRKTGSALSIKLDGIYLPSLLDTIRRAPKATMKKALGIFDAARHVVGLLAFVEPNRISSKHIAKLPSTLGELRQFAREHALSLDKALQQISRIELTQGAVPVILAIQRPRPLIGTQSSMELLNFLVDLGDSQASTANRLANNARVSCNVQVRPTTVRLAKELSRSEANLDCVSPARGMLLGCGALGSKVALHLARAGHVLLSLVDNDTYAPHNSIRNGLSPDCLGDNKAEATKATIESIFFWDKNNTAVRAIPKNAIDVLFQNNGQALQGHVYILDCTASVSVLNALVDTRMAGGPRVMRSEIAHRGQLGLVLIEGPDRNPRLDDLQAFLYDRAIDDDRIASWLGVQRDDTELDVGPALEEISIGLGCSSHTMRMADDLVSYHAAVASMTVRHVLERSPDVAGIQISSWGKLQIGPAQTEFNVVGQWVSLAPNHTQGWQVRLPGTLATQLQQQMRSALPNETGGLLVGFLHPKRKVFYITRSLSPPPDSQGWPYAFRLGIRDVPQQLEQISDRTGGLIRYVGEWHSHPHGSASLSNLDLQAVQQISRSLKGRQPTHIMIVTEEGCYPYMFEANYGDASLSVTQE